VQRRGRAAEPAGAGSDLDAVTAAALRARAGDEDSAARFVRATQAEVWRLCAHLGTPGSADDLTQETYARAFGALHRFAGRSSARTWLLSIARRVCADAVRAAVRDRARPMPRPEPERDHADRVVLHDLLGALSAPRRTAFVLTQILGLSYQEAAEVCGCPVGTIRSRVARARADLLDGLGGGMGRAGPAQTG
jgi:RNA polymerase sigma-70 factor (ECF subfamily)